MIFLNSGINHWIFLEGGEGGVSKREIRTIVMSYHILSPS